MMRKCRWGEEIEEEAGKQLTSFSSSLISHKSTQWQTTLVSNRELSVIDHFASIYLFPMPISAHPSLLSVLPTYHSISFQRIWQVKAKAAVFYILFLLFKVHGPAKWIISEPETPAGVPCYKCAAFSILSTWRTKDLKALEQPSSTIVQLFTELYMRCFSVLCG